ncbi:DUF2927 domain-containing protein [Roseobacter weihaiensis]|uniref:DUF2927 domain-containing protein n=1 Tax=Roseobacter weihaiensis TaxID=2763262 RepID=UPI0029CAC52C|nr:DUF2927 domain-containing protein [Roseobacter sp. H9]
MRWACILPLVALLGGCVSMPQSTPPSRAVIADSTLPPMKMFPARAPLRQPLSNAALTRDFLALSFQMESGRQLPVLTRFEGPISLRVTGRPPPTLSADLAQLLTRLKREAGLDISTTTAAQASITIEAVPRSDIHRVLPQAACFVAPNVRSLAEFRSARRNPATNWALLETRETLAIIVPSDASPQEVRDCLHEELAQALGPLNDLYRLPSSVFNDDNVHTVLTDFDMLILRATYAPELRSGMSRAEAAEVLPKVFARLNPGGASLRASAVSATPQAYIRAIETALGPGASPATRQRAAATAVRIATEAGWADNRRGFAHYAQGRVLQSTNSVAAQQAFRRADQFYARSRTTRLHRAYVATQLGAYALAEGDPARARALVTPHIDRARASQNAALLATLQLLRAEALIAEGRISEGRALRLDSLGWARYGFGADWAVHAKLREISALFPADPPV